MIASHRPIFPLLALLIVLGGAACADDGSDHEVLTPFNNQDQANNQEDANNEDEPNNQSDTDNQAEPNQQNDPDNQGEPDNQSDPDNQGPPNHQGNNQSNNDNEGCLPQNDGILRREAFDVETGLEIPYRLAFDVDVDTAGEVVDDELHWDLSDDFNGDTTESLALDDPADYWFGDDHPTATYTTPLSAAEEELGIFHLGDDGLYLQGVASPDDEGFSTTELVHEPAIPIIAFPLEEGDSWTTTADVSGTYDGYSISSGTETYTSTVDGHGQLETPFGTFTVWRINTYLEQSYTFTLNPWFSFSQDTRIHTFVAECAGTVARIRSRVDGADVDADAPEFDVASEVMRLAL